MVQVEVQTLREKLIAVEAKLAQMQAAVDCLADGVVLADEQANLLHWNPAALRLHGFDSLDEVRRHLSRFTETFVMTLPNGNTLPLSEWPIQRLIRGESLNHVELNVTRLDTGRSWIIRYSGAVVAASQGMGRLVVLTLQDLTALRNADRAALEIERQLNDQQKLLRTLIEGIDDPVYIKDKAGRFMYVNQVLARIGNVGIRDCIGRTAGEVFGALAGPLSQSSDRLALQSSEQQTYEDSVPVGGELRHYLITKCRFLNVDGSIGGLFGISRDITALKSAERAVRDGERVARERQVELAHLERLQTMGHLAAGLAHELNQPLGAIVNFAAAGRHHLAGETTDPKQIEQTFAKIVAEASRAGEIIRRLRSFVQKQRPHVDRNDIASVIHESLQLLDFEFRHAGVMAEVEVSSDLPTVLVDSVQISQVLINLLRNALDAMTTKPANQRRLKLRGYSDADGLVAVSVSDSGTAVGEAELTRLFDAFYTTKPDGMGIGLALCRRIIEDHGGRIAARRNSGSGMTFTFYIPKAVGEKIGA